MYVFSVIYYAARFSNNWQQERFLRQRESDYTAALALASNTTGDVSGKVSTKNEQKKVIKKVMTSLLLILKGNFHDTYKAEYRKWGWKKEIFLMDINEMAKVFSAWARTFAF